LIRLLWSLDGNKSWKADFLLPPFMPTSFLSTIIRRKSMEFWQTLDFIPHFLNLVSISSTYLRTFFTPVAPQSVRAQSSCQYLFTLSGSTSIKVVHKTLMKLSPYHVLQPLLNSYNVIYLTFNFGVLENNVIPCP